MEINNLPEEELIYPNCIAFNGIINGDFIQKGNTFLADMGTLFSTFL